MFGVSNINPSVSAKFSRLTVKFNGDKFSLSARLRSLGDGTECWQMFPKSENATATAELTVANVAKALRTIGIKVSAEAVKGAKVSTSAASTSASMKSIVMAQAKYSKGSGCAVTYQNGEYFIDVDGDTVAALRNDEADDFTATVNKYAKQANVDVETARLAAAKPWVENSV